MERKYRKIPNVALEVCSVPERIPPDAHAIPEGGSYHRSSPENV